MNSDLKVLLLMSGVFTKLALGENFFLSGRIIQRAPQDWAPDYNISPL